MNNNNNNNITIQCRGIKKSYGEGETKVEALRGIDMDIYANQLTLLVGPSGSGKTSLLSIITSILTPDSGDLFILGKDIHKMHENERAHFCGQNLGIVFQSLFLIPTLTVVENVTLPLLIMGESEKVATEKSMIALKEVNIAHRANSSPENLSKGQQQRVAIARAIVNDAKIIVCDEPTSALDHNAGMSVMSILQNLALHPGRSVIVVTHDQRIFSFANRIIRISDGQITEGKGDE